MLIMDRDKILFQKLHTHAVMTTKQIGAVVFPGVDLKTVLRRLGKLEEQSYIERIEGLPTYQRVWVLTHKGSYMVSDKPPRNRQSRFQLEHDVKLTALRLRLEEHGISKFWIPEHEIRAKVCAKEGIERAKKKVIPDGIMGVEYKDLKESVAIELELHSKNSKRYRRTFWDYRNKRNLFAVWYLTPTKELAKHIEKLWQKENDGTSKPHFFWSVAEDVVMNGKNAEINQREHKIKIHQIWKGGVPNKGADTPADRVSTQEVRNPERKNELTAELNDEILTPAI
jgi:hypothetical protein